MFFVMVCGFGLGVSILCCLLLRKLFDIYRTRYFLYSFWLINFISLLAARMVQKDLVSTAIAPYIVEMAVLWFMGQLFIVILAPIWIVMKKIAIRRIKQETANTLNLERRAFIKGMALSLPAAAMGISCYGSFRASKNVELFQHDIILADLPDGFDSFKIGQLSDTHIGLFFSADKLRECLKRLAVERVDVVVITGDLIDDLSMLPDVVRVINECSENFEHGIYFSWGNHEYFRNFDLVKQSLSSSSLKILRNEHNVLVRGDSKLYILGVDYPWAKDAKKQEEECQRMLDTAVKGTVGESIKVLLSHHPAFIDVAYASDIDLTLTGHTHGGQVAFLGQTILPIRYKYMRGMYIHDHKYAYVNAGAGSWFPFRLGCPAEITIFRLKKSLS